MRGRVLDAVIRSELEQMVAEGVDKSPITATNLHKRLKKKGFIKGDVSTLGTIARKQMIEEFRTTQIAKSDLSQLEKKELYGKKRKVRTTVSVVSKHDTIELQRQLDANNAKIALIIEAAEANKFNTDGIFADYFA